MNSRVQRTVDFESTAIPGYATSAISNSTNEAIISMMETRLTVRICFTQGDEKLILESEIPIMISDALSKLSIMHTTVLICSGDTIIPHNTMITGDIELQMITVSSGG